MAANTPVTSPADLINVALAKIGYKKRVGNPFDGSDAAQQALDIYGQTRDEVLREVDYDFAMRTVVLTQLKAAPPGGYFPPTVWNPATNPPMPYAFEYGFPDDALKIRNVKPTALFLYNPDPQFNPFQIANDAAFAPARRVILCNVPDAVATFTAQVTDLATWDVASVEAFAAALARRLAPALASMDAAKLEMSDETVQRAIAGEDQR